MIVRIEKCPHCGEQVVLVMPKLFPDITAKNLEKFKKLSLAPIADYCKKCKIK